MKIATLNTWKNEGDYPRRLDAMEQLLRDSNPDFILLQEVLHVPTLEIHTGKTLAQRLGYELIDAPARRKLRKIDGQPFLSYSGLSILSRHPVGDFLKVNLPSSVSGGERIALFAKANCDHCPVLIGNIHLSHRRDENEIKHRQWTKAIDDSLEKWEDMPLLIGGDMNTNLDQPEHFDLFHHKHCEIIDAYTANPANPTESTHPVPDNPDRAGRRIDSIFLVRKTSQKPPEIIPQHARISGKTPLPGASVYPSDHAMVEITFRFSDA